MSKKGFQAFAAGMIVATSVLGGTYLLSGNQQVEADTEQELSENEVEKFLTSKQQTAISIDEYEELLATKNSKVTEEAPTEKTSDNTQATGKTEETKEEVIKYNVTIKAGMTTSEVSDLLEQNGIISDSFDFDQYLIKNNYHTKVQLGTFEVQKGMSHNELAEAITR